MRRFATRRNLLFLAAAIAVFAVVSAAAFIAEQAEEIGGLRADLRGERGQREHAERERDELRARLAASEDNPPMQSAPVAPGGVQREPEASWRVRLRRWMGWG